MSEVSETSITFLNLKLHISRFRIIFIHLVPCLALVILNCLLFSGMKKAEERKSRLRTGNGGKVVLALKDLRRSESQESKTESLTSFCSLDSLVGGSHTFRVFIFSL